MKAVVVAISGLLLAAAPALAQTGSAMTGAQDLASENQDTPASTGNGERGPGAERRICRRVETSSTSRMATRRVCRTAAEWRESQRR